MEDEMVVIQFGIMLIAASYYILRKRRRWYNRRWWVRPSIRERQQRGAYNNIFQIMQDLDEEEFFGYTRMNKAQFHYLEQLLTPLLKKRSRRKSLSVGHRLAMTLKYLAHGGSTRSLGWEYFVAQSTAQKVIKETCKAIWKTLSPLYLRVPSSEEFLEIAEGFRARWQFPNCIGAIDGKHIAIQAPINAGSLFYNYKKTHSIILMAVCDADYNFTIVNIGAYGSQSDGGVFNKSIGEAIQSGKITLPPDSNISVTLPKMPFYLLGDAAFPLQTWLMRPYPGRNLDIEKSVFNYRLSRGRRTIENAFGILSSRWRIFKSAIVAEPETVEAYVSACVCLHNFLKKGNSSNLYCPSNYADTEVNGEIIEGFWRQEGHTLPSVGRVSTNFATRVAYDVRNALASYFVSPEGEVPWQFMKVTEVQRNSV